MNIRQFDGIKLPGLRRFFDSDQAIQATQRLR